MIHRAVTIERVKAEECRESWFSKSRDPEKGFGSPPTPGAIPLIRHTQAKPSRIIHPPTSAPVLTLSHKNKLPTSLPFVQSSPVLAYSAQHWCCSLPNQIGSPCREETEGESAFPSMPWSPYMSLAHRGQGSPHSCQPQLIQLCCQLGLLRG